MNIRNFFENMFISVAVTSVILCGYLIAILIGIYEQCQVHLELQQLIASEQTGNIEALKLYDNERNITIIIPYFETKDQIPKYENAKYEYYYMEDKLDIFSATGEKLTEE